MTYNAYDVIVLGGGISGLTACYELTNLGAQVCLLEPRDRLGGQIHTFFTDDHIPIDLGAMYVHGRGDIENPNPLYPLLERYQIQTTKVDIYNSDLFDTKGETQSLLERQKAIKKGLDEAITKIQSAKKMSNPCLPTVAEVLNYQKVNLPKRDSDEYWVRKLVTASIKHHTGAELDDLSLIDLISPPQYKGEEELVVNGYQQLAQGLIQDALSTKNLDVHLNIKPIYISHDPRNPTVEVTTEDGQSFQAKAILCTLPLSVLKQGKISFQPELSNEFQNALKHFKMGNQNKVFLEFSKAFWPKDKHFLYPNDPDIEYWPEYLNLYAITKGKCNGLLASFYGDKASFQSYTEQDIIRQALAPLMRVYPKTALYFERGRISHWDSDIYSLGGGVYCSIGCLEKHIDALNANQLGALFFANAYQRVKEGHQATVEGAFEAGVAAALSINAYLKHQLQYDEDHKTSKKRPKR